MLAWRRIKVVTLLVINGCFACGTAISQKARDTALINYDLGIASFNRGDTREALRVLLSAIQNDPDLPEAHNALGLVYHALDKRDAALEHYEKAVSLRPRFSEAYNNLGTLLLDMGRYDEAIVAFNTALGDILYTTPSLAEGNLGWAYYKKNDVEAAIEHISNAVQTNPLFCRGYEWLSRIAVEQNRPSDIIAYGERFKRHCLDNVHIAGAISADYRREMQYYLAIGHLKQGRREVARTLLSQCAVRDSEASGFAAKCAQSLDALK